MNVAGKYVCLKVMNTSLFDDWIGLIYRSERDILSLPRYD